MSRTYARAALFFAAFLLAACGDDADGDTCDCAVPTDAGDDGGVDSGTDVGDDADTGSDVDDDVSTGPVCNDGLLHTSEECEGFDLRGMRCEDLGFDGGRLACGDGCTFDTSGCSSCGDDVADAAEACDGTDVRGAACSDWLGEGALGEVECASDCRSLLISDCRDPAPASPLDACDPDASDPCEEGLSCVTTSVGSYCLESCASDRECDPEDFCRDQGEGESACAPRPTLGDACEAAVGCGDGSACVAAFDSASVCAEVCALGTDACGDGVSCIVPPAAPTEVGDTCSPAGGDCDTDAGFECASADGGETWQCARPIGLCAGPSAFYQFEGFGPAEDVLCDLVGPTAGGRFCAGAGGDAFAMCYPVFGDDAAFGACVALCDDGASGRTDRDCGSGWTCAVPDSPELFHPDPDGTDCSSVGEARCSTDYPACIDFGDGAVCARPSRICVEEGA